MADPSPKRRLVLTRHAANAVIDRKLEIEWLDRTVNDADASERDRVWPDAVRASKVIPESDGRVLRVVYVPEGKDVARVLTVVFDRGRRK